MKGPARFGFALAVLVACSGALSGACGGSSGDDTTGDTDGELRQLESGVDVNEVIVEKVPATPAPDDALPHVSSWTVRYVELRDPANPNNPDPTDPFNGFFLVANDASGTPLFFDTMALTDQGVAHFFFSFDTATDANGNASYVELPLVAAEGDTVGARASRARSRGSPASGSGSRMRSRSTSRTPPTARA